MTQRTSSRLWPHSVRVVFWCTAILGATPFLYSQDIGTRRGQAVAPSDGGALAAIFAEQHVAESGIPVCETAVQLEPERRYAFLKDWVLPPDSVSGFRVTADFVAATDPRGRERLPSSSDTPAEDSSGSTSETVNRATMISPAGMLVELAHRIGKSGALRKQITSRPAISKRDQCDQVVLLSLLSMADNDLEQAKNHIDKLFQFFINDMKTLDDARQGILLCYAHAVKSPALHESIREPLALMQQNYRTEYDRRAWHRHLWAVAAQTIQTSHEDAPAVQTSSSRWHQATRVTSFEHGSAFPTPRWRFEPGAARIDSSYGDDFLFYASPLNGDFEIEGQTTGFGYRESQLMVAGKWIGLVYDHARYMVGNIRGELYRESIGEKMTDTHRHGLIQSRVKRRGGVLTAWLNGRETVTFDLPQDPYPWIALRSNYRVHGGVDDLRIIGSPTIPETISLVESPELLGWYDYFQSPRSSPSRLTGWHAFFDRDATGQQVVEIRNPRNLAAPVGSHQESLLVYARPMMEDGEIRYEFWYQPADENGVDAMAHPAVGRTCYLIGNDGVTLHQLTDGQYERSTLRPDNERTPTQTSKESLSLKPNAWNEMRLVRQGDSLRLILNGQPILTTPFPTSEYQQSFGLFHFADRSVLRVRDLSWTGDWPKALLPVDQQQLSGDILEALAWQAEEPPAEFVHRFNETSFSDGKFVVTEGDPAVTVEATPDGVIVRQQSDTGYRGTLISPFIDVRGDFDIIATYDQFVSESELEKIGSVRMHIVADSEHQDLALLQRVEDRSNEQKIQCLRMSTIEGRERRHYFGRQPNDSNAGKLRLSRRGDTVYYLAANNDSDYFRLIGKETYVTDDLESRGIRLGVQTQGPNGLASVRFKQFAIRAERLGGPAAIDPAQVIAKLNRERDALIERLNIDFAKTPPDEDRFYRWADTRDWDPSAGGLEIKAEGAEAWTSAGMNYLPGLTGDFDVQFEFDPIDLPTPPPGQRSQVYLQIELADAERTQMSALLTRSESGGLSCQGQVRSRVDGNYVYSTAGNQRFEDPDYLRLLRRGTEVYYLAGRHADNQEILIGMVETSNAILAPGGIRMMLHTGGEGRTSRMLAKSLKIRAEGTLDVVARQLVPQPPEPKSFSSRVYDAFRNLFQ